MRAHFPHSLEAAGGEAPARGRETSFPGVVDQHHIGFAMAANDGQLFAVGGIIEIADELRLEVSELPARSTIQMLQPEISVLPSRTA